MGSHTDTGNRKQVIKYVGMSKKTCMEKTITHSPGWPGQKRKTLLQNNDSQKGWRHGSNRNNSLARTKRGSDISTTIKNLKGYLIIC
jgi:hypothetical protein